MKVTIFKKPSPQRDELERMKNDPVAFARRFSDVRPSIVYTPRLLNWRGKSKSHIQ